jgi:hypothetical protein
MLQHPTHERDLASSHMRLPRPAWSGVYLSSSSFDSTSDSYTILAVLLSSLLRSTSEHVECDPEQHQFSERYLTLEVGSMLHDFFPLLSNAT